MATLNVGEKRIKANMEWLRDRLRRDQAAKSTSFLGLNCLRADFADDLASTLPCKAAKTIEQSKGFYTAGEIKAVQCT